MPTPPLSDEVLRETVRVMEQHNGHTTRAAEALKLSRSALRDRLKMAEGRGLNPARVRDARHNNNVSEDLLEFAVTGRQKEIIQAVLDTGGTLEASARLGIDQRNVQRALAKVRLVAASANSILYKEGEGKLLHWVKLSANVQAQYKAIEEALDGLFQSIKPRKPVQARLAQYADELCLLYPEGDPHWGMRVWGAETDGTNYDLEIAQQEYYAAVDYLISVATPSAEAISLNIGDNFHSDTPEDRTRRSGHNLNTDGRLSKVFDTVLEARRYKIERMLEKHQKITVVEIPGNHDEVMSMAFRKALRAYYANEPRVEVADLDHHPKLNNFWYYHFGSVLFGATHGHEAKFEDMPIIMATDVPDLWGATRHRHIFTGHLHHRRTSVLKPTGKDLVGATVEMLRTIAPTNEFEHNNAYRSLRTMFCRTYHKEYGSLFTNEIGGEAIQYLSDQAAAQ